MRERSEVSDRFERPTSVADATRLLAAGGWQVLAGGTDVYPAHVGRPLARPLLDISGITALRGIRRGPSGWSIGAATTWTDVLRADLPPLFDALKQAGREVGGVQIQNAGTVAGNLCNASPAADGTPVLIALDGAVVLRSTARQASRRGGRFRARQPAHRVRTRRACRLDRDPGAKRAGAIGLPEARRPTLPDDLDDDGRARRRRRRAGAIDQARAVVGGCSASARRLPALEARLVGARLDDDLPALVDAADLAPLTPIDDLRASAAYRLDATATLLRRALAQLKERT